MIDFDGPPTIVEPLREYFRRDIDIIRPSLLNRVSEQWPEDTVCEGPHDERYNPVVKSAKKLKVNVLQELEDANIKLWWHLELSVEQWSKDAVCEKTIDEKYNPVVRNLKILKFNVFKIWKML